jgi:hypothetical protein
MAQTPYSFSRRGGGSAGLHFQLDVPAVEMARLHEEFAGRAKMIPKVTAGAINKTLGFSRTLIVNEIRDRITAKRSNVFRRTDIIKASPSKLEGKVTIQGQRIGLINFKHWASRRNGVSVQLYQGGPVLRFLHAFKGVGVESNAHIFEREIRRLKIKVARPHHLPNRGRRMHPLRMFYGLSLRRLFNESPDMIDKVKTLSSQQLVTELDRQIVRFAPKS